MFHQGTQKGGRKSSYTKQVMERENRKIYARVNNLYRNKEDVSEKAAYRGGAWTSAPVHPPECGGGLECVVLLNFYLKCIVTVAHSK